MCGICGFYTPSKRADAGVLERMKGAIRHRGPDDDGTELVSLSGEHRNLAVGFVRLSIRDLSINGHQPMWNDAHNIMVCLNGEIYNADELREEYFKDVSFHSTSDTEVLLRIYERLGLKEALRVIDGMYAMCIVDLRKGCMHLVRDRVGEKPLYYFTQGDDIIWASEYKAFYEYPSFKAVLDEDNFHESFIFGTISDGGTLLHDVKNLLPGSRMEIRPDGTRKLERYWTFENGFMDGSGSSRSDDSAAGMEGQSQKTLHEAAEDVEQLLEKSIRRRMIADVGVGVQLSGGIDSSLVSYYSSQKIKDMNSYGVVFDNEEYSEKKYMEHVVSKTGIHPHYYELPREGFLNLMRETTFYTEEPVGTVGNNGLFLINRKAKKDVSVMLCGEGADEVFGGYGRYSLFAYLKRHLFVRLLYIAKKCIQDRSFYALSIAGLDMDKWFVLSESDAADYTRKICPRIKAKKHLDRRSKQLKGIRAKNPEHKILIFDQNYLMQGWLMRADKTSMASSIELRVPFLMPELLDYVRALSGEFLIKPSIPHFGDPMKTTKVILKTLSQRIFGNGFTFRSKNGFGVPFTEYLRDDETVRMIEGNILPSIRERGIFNYAEVLRMWEDFKVHMWASGGEHRFARRLYVIVAWEIWFQEFIDGSPLEYASEHIVPMEA